MQPSPSDSIQEKTPYLAISYGSLSEAFFQACCDAPDNDNLMVSVKKGLEARILSHRTPPAVVRLLINMHNRFHFGSGTSWVEIIQMVPDVFRLFE